MTPLLNKNISILRDCFQEINALDLIDLDNLKENRIEIMHTDFKIIINESPSVNYIDFNSK